MQAPVGTYLRHPRHGLGRVLRWEHGLFPRIHLRFEDGVDRALDVDPTREVHRSPPDRLPDPSTGKRAGLTLAPSRTARRGLQAVRLAEGGSLECVAGHDAVGEPIVFTIGYEGRGVDDFLQVLQQHRVGVVVDIREAPHSKRRGFAKAELEARLREQRIGYVVQRKWGNPKRKAGGVDERRDPPRAMTAYTAYLAPHIVQAAQFVQEIVERRPAFLCYEGEPFHCHRSRFTALVLPHCHPQPAVHHILPPTR